MTTEALISSRNGLIHEENPELGITYFTPEGVFEVDGIIYTPPWLMEKMSVHWNLMVDIKYDGCSNETKHGECACWWRLPE